MNALRLTLLVSMATICAPPAHARMAFGVLGGPRIAGVSYQSDFFEHDLKLHPAWSAGVQLFVPIRSLELETGVRYEEYGDRLGLRFDVTGGSTKIEAHQAWRYVAVPALVRIHPAWARGLSLGLGPEAGYLLEVWHRETYTTTTSAAGATGAFGREGASPAADIFEDAGTFDDPTRAYRRWNLALAGSLGLTVPIAGRTGEIELRYAHGLVDIAKSDAIERETRGLDLLVGMRW